MKRAGDLLGLWWAGVCFNLYLRKAYQGGASPRDQGELGNSYAKVIRKVCGGLGITVPPEAEGGIAQLSNAEWRRIARQMATAIDPKSTAYPDQPEGWQAMWRKANAE